jgi:hypothetical protein
MSMRKLTAIASIAAALAWSGAAQSQVLDPFSACMERCDVYANEEMDFAKYERCRYICLVKYPPMLAPPGLDAKLD